MKKIFTLISMALVAMSVNAQTPDVWRASDLTFTEDATLKKPVLDGMVISDNKAASYVIPSSDHIFPVGTWETNPVAVTEWLAHQVDPSQYATSLKEYTFTASTSYVSLKAVSTPNSDKNAADAWQFAGAEDDKELSATGYETFKGYIKANTGNPSVGYYDYYELNNENQEVHRVSDVIWEDGSSFLPAKGCYYEFTCSEDGPLTIAVFWPKNLANNKVYIIDESTGGSGNAYTRIAGSSVTIKGFRNNNKWEKHTETEEAAVPGEVFTFALDDDGLLTTSPESIQDNMNQPLFAYVTWNVKKNVTYMVMCPKNQPGLLGFQFTPSGETGISNVKAEDANAPVYNLAGQKADKSQKGILIQNGKKFVNK